MMSNRFARPALASAVAMFVVSLTALAQAPRPGKAPPPGVLLYASFDGQGEEEAKPSRTSLPGKRGQYPTADFAVGDPLPSSVGSVTRMPNGRFGRAARVTNLAIKNARGMLAFDGLGNILVRRGTLAFWARLDQCAQRSYLVWVNTIQCGLGHTAGMTFLELRYDPVKKRLSFLSSDARRNRIMVGSRLAWPKGAWRHFAVAWDAALGWRVYVDGKLVIRHWGKPQLYLHSDLDNISLGSRATACYQYNERADFSFDELYVFDYVLNGKQIAALIRENRPPPARPGPTAEAEAAGRKWLDLVLALNAKGVPNYGGGVLEARLAPVSRLWDVRMDLRQPMDGKALTAWPTRLKGYAKGGRRLEFLCPAPTEVNYLRVLGDLRGELRVGDATAARIPGAPAVQRVRLDRPVTITKGEVRREKGDLEELEMFRLGSGREPERDTLVLDTRLAPAPGLDKLGVTGLRLSGFYSPGDRSTLLATPDAAPGSVTIEPCRFLHIVTQPAAKDLEIGKWFLDLALDGFTGKTTLFLRIHDPVTRTRTLADFDLRFDPAAGGRRVRLLLDGPPLLLAKGRRAWVSLLFDRPGRVVCGPEGSRFAAVRATPAQRRNDLEALKRALCDQFMYMSQAGAWRAQGKAFRGNPRTQFKGVGEVFDLCEHMLRFDRDNTAAACLLSWMLRWRKTWDPKVSARYTDPLKDVLLDDVKATGPDWAVGGREALKAMRRYVNWWACERANENGELGSALRNDTSLVNDFINFSLINDPDDRLKTAYRALADYSWHGFLKDGVSKRYMDHLHAFEEGTCLQHGLTVLFYGNPEYVERLMVISRSYDSYLTRRTPEGDRYWRSNWFSATRIGPPQVRNDDPRKWKILMFQPGRYLVWYNGNPHVLSVLREWQDTWLKFMRAQVAKGRPVPGAPDGVPHNLYWLYRMTGDKRYSDVVTRAVRAGVRRYPPTWPRLRKVAPDPAADKAFLRYRPAYQLGRDRAGLIEILRARTLYMKKYLPGHTWVGQSADRVAIPQYPLPQMYLGGSADAAKRQGYLYNAVSWEGADDDVSRFVVECAPSRLKVLIYSFHDKPLDIVMRVWDLDLGRYRVRAGADTRGDETIGKVVLDEERTLYRYEPIRLTVPPRRVYVVTCEQRRRLGRIRDRTDLALGPQDVKIVGGALRVTVHNIGALASPAGKVRLTAAGRVVAEAPFPAFAAPTDLRPKTATVTFKNVPTTRPLRVTVTSDRPVPEITPVNNEAIVPQQ